MRRYYRYYLRTVLLVLALCYYEGAGAVLADRYDEQHPLVIACDWDMPPGEFLDENGRPAGYVVDLMNAIFKQLGVPHVFEMRESVISREAFRKHRADVIVAPVDVLKLLGGRISTSAISRYHYKVLMRSNEPEIKSLRDIKPSQTIVLRKGEDLAMTLLEPSNLNIDQQPPMEAIVGVATGRYDFFVWGEEPMMWRLRKLHLESLRICDVSLPAFDIHIGCHDQELLEAIDSQFARLEKSGVVDELHSKWFSFKREQDGVSPYVFYATIAGMLLLLTLF